MGVQFLNVPDMFGVPSSLSTFSLSVMSVVSLKYLPLKYSP